MTKRGNEFQVRIPVNLGGFAEKFPFGRIGEEVPPRGISEEDYPRTAEFREGQRFIRFGRPFRPDVESETTLTDADNGMWIPDRLLVEADPTIAR